MSRSILIIGGSGQLGKALRAIFPDASAVPRSDLDMSNPASLDAFD